MEPEADWPDYYWEWVKTEGLPRSWNTYSLRLEGGGRLMLVVGPTGHSSMTFVPYEPYDEEELAK